MTWSIGPTHDPSLKSWVESANDPLCDFPVQNLPFGIFETDDLPGGRAGVAIGDQIVDLKRATDGGLFDSLHPRVREAMRQSSLNTLMALDAEDLSRLRARLSELLCVPENRKVLERNPVALLVPMNAARMLLPAVVGDYTDFYASVFHATNVGKLFRPDNPLLSNYKYVPIGYHGRASSLVVSGTPVKRPSGQRKDPHADEPVFEPSRSLDYELEAGFFAGSGNQIGEPIPIDKAQSHIFGMCLVNDWSARDIQSWEYQPLGPFLGKNFATSISPWVITMEALAPFRVPAFSRPDGDPAPLPYLSSTEEAGHGGLDILLEVWLSSAAMRQAGIKAALLSRSNSRDLYWTIGQLLTHHASNGCNIRPGDLLASGTVSGSHPGEQGCLLEMTRRGDAPVMLPTGEERRFLEDGDEVTFRGYCERQRFVRVGFGECRGIVIKA